MHRKRRVLIIILLLGVLAALPAISLQAQTDGPGWEVPVPDVRWQQASLQQDAAGRVAVLVELQSGATLGGVSSELAVLGAEELYRTRTRLIYANGAIAVLINPQDLAAAMGLPGVQGVHPIATKEVLDTLNLSAVDGAVEQRVFPDGATGQGVRIGVIDSGIDYTHATFGGAGTPQAYTNNNPRVIEAGSFPTAKVVGGYDFAGDTYNVIDSPVPTPDNDPLDCQGHGTHVASTIAGFGVDATGATYTGSYTASTDFTTFRVSPGLAPEAQLYAFKVLGCANSRATTLLFPAIEYALDPNGDGNTADRLDILMVSLGAPFAGTDDPDFVAVQAAVEAGMVVVVGAGNASNPLQPATLANGSAFYAVHSPGSVTGAISVAAIDTTSTLTSTLFSNLGPQRNRRAIKPDLAAPGVTIQAAAFGSGAGAAVSTGTAGAAAHVAGAAALLRQLHPAWTARQVKAALMNTATPLQNSGATYSLTRAGVGRLDLAGAANTTLLAYATEPLGAVGLNFGSPRVADTFERSLDLTIENLGDQPQEVDIQLAAETLGVTPGLPNPGLNVSPEAASLTVPAGSAITTRVRAQIDGDDLALVTDPAIPLRQNRNPRHYLPEQSGALVVSPVGTAQGGVLVPYFVAAQTASDARISKDFLVVPGGIGVVLATVRNTGVRDFLADEKFRPLLSAFELAYSSDNEPGSTGSIDAADIRYVGVASNYNLVGQDLVSTSVFFGIAAHSPWSTPNEVRFEVWIDANKDGSFDYVLASSNLGELTQTGHPNDVFLGALLKTPLSGQIPPSLSFLNGFPAPFDGAGQDTAPFNSSVLFMVVDAKQLLNNGQADFFYQVRSYHRDAGNFSEAKLVDQTPILSYDAARPAIDATNPRNPPGGSRLAQTPVYLSTNGAPVFVRVRGDLIASPEQSGLLVLFHHNPTDRQAQVVPIDTGFTDPVALIAQSTPGEQDPLTHEMADGSEFLGTKLLEEDPLFLPIIVR